MSDNIPFEMQVEIMKSLHVKSLAISRSVSKLWKSLIDSPVFIADYTNMRQHHRLLLRYEVGTFFDTEFTYVSIMDNDDTLSRHTLDNVPVSFELLKKLKTVGMSQGLLCLSGISREDDCIKITAVIWNPPLGKSIAVDIPYQHKRSSVTSIGFGVRPDNCDPMTVRVCVLEHPCRAMVFTLSSRVWRVPRGNLPSESIFFINSSQVATNDRCIYWKAYESQRSINLVVAFDMVSEDFTEINLPHSLAYREIYDFSISRIKDSLALLEYYDDAKKRVCGVSMMVEEDGVSKSFTKLFTINTPDASFIKVLGFRKNDLPIMETKKHWPSSSVEVYKPHTGSIKNLGIDGVRDVFFCFYTESLLLLDQLDGQFIEIQLQL